MFAFACPLAFVLRVIGLRWVASFTFCAELGVRVCERSAALRRVVSALVFLFLCWFVFSMSHCCFGLVFLAFVSVLARWFSAARTLSRTGAQCCLAVLSGCMN